MNNKRDYSLPMDKPILCQHINLDFIKKVSNGNTTCGL